MPVIRSLALCTLLTCVFMYNPIIIALVFLLLIALIIFINVRNKKDKKDLVDTLNRDYKKPRDEEGEMDIDLKE